MPHCHIFMFSRADPRAHASESADDLLYDKARRASSSVANVHRETVTPHQIPIVRIDDIGNGDCEAAAACLTAAYRLVGASSTLSTASSSSSSPSTTAAAVEPFPMMTHCIKATSTHLDAHKEYDNKSFLKKVYKEYLLGDACAFHFPIYKLSKTFDNAAMQQQMPTAAAKISDIRRKNNPSKAMTTSSSGYGSYTSSGGSSDSDPEQQQQQKSSVAAPRDAQPYQESPPVVKRWTHVNGCSSGNGVCKNKSYFENKKNFPSSINKCVGKPKHHECQIILKPQPGPGWVEYDLLAFKMQKSEKKGNGYSADETSGDISGASSSVDNSPDCCRILNLSSPECGKGNDLKSAYPILAVLDREVPCAATLNNRMSVLDMARDFQRQLVSQERQRRASSNGDELRHIEKITYLLETCRDDHQKRRLTKRLTELKMNLRDSNKIIIIKMFIFKNAASLNYMNCSVGDTSFATSSSNENFSAQFSVREKSFESRKSIHEIPIAVVGGIASLGSRTPDGQSPCRLSNGDNIE
uniref:Uncharacterized protein n=1 Tax=Romanomermis culicivorax TaxID=13658 RepID=A0A915KM98_ROMCU